MRAYTCFGLALLLVALLVNCGGPPPLEWETLDRYDFNVAEADPDLQIPARHLYEWLYFSRVEPEGGLVTDSVIGAFRDSVLVDTLIGLTCDQFDLPAYWYHHREYRDRYHNILRQAFWDYSVGSKVVLDSQEVIDYYNDDQEEFAVPEQVDGYHILSSWLGFRQGPDSALVDHYTREDLWDFSEVFIRRLHQLLIYGEPFENVAYNFSHDVHSREKGGHLGWTKRGVYIDPFDSVAFSLKDGEFSEPYKDADGWHILYRARHNPGGPQPLDTPWVYVKAQQAVFDAKATEMAARIIDSLRNRSSITINDVVLTDTIIYLIDDTVWAAVVNEADTVDVLTLKGLEKGYRDSYRVSNTTPEMRRVMVEHAAGPVLVVQAARHLGLDSLPEQVAAGRRIWRETVKALRLAQLYGVVEWEPDDSVVARYYQEHFDEYNPEKRIQAQQLVVKDEELAHFLREQVSSGFTLDYLAEYYGREEGYDIKFEDLGVVKEGSVDSVLYDALNRTHAHQYTRVVETGRGYHIAKVLDRNYPRTLEMARGEIRGRLQSRYRQDKYEAFRDELFRKHQARFPGLLPPFELPRLSQRNHYRTLPGPIGGRGY